jgi:hypothetical protein
MICGALDLPVACFAAFFNPANWVTEAPHKSRESIANHLGDLTAKTPGVTANRSGMIARREMIERAMPMT